MSMFPGAGAVVYYNEAGEPLGWDYPSEPDPADLYDDRDEDQTFKCRCGESFWMDDEGDVLSHYEVCTEPDWLVKQFPDELSEVE